jgi:predicted TIM-barrel fold metal-dependent hydrolase
LADAGKLARAVRCMIIDCHNHLGVDLLLYLRAESPYAQELGALIGKGRGLGIDRWIVFPMASNISLSLRAMQEARIEFPGELAKVPYAFENRRMMQEIYDLFPDLGKRTIPFAMVDPMRDAEAQVKELWSLRGDYKFYGLKIESTIIQSEIRSLVRQGRCFLELASQWDIPFLIHTSVHPDDSWAQVQDVLWIVEQHPEVRFCLTHSCRFDKSSLDRLNELPNAWFDCSAHGLQCKCAVQDSPAVAERGRRFDSDYGKPAQVMADLALAYPDKFLWGSDSPFHRRAGGVGSDPCRFDGSYEEEVQILRAQSQDVISRIAERNTLSFLKRDDEGFRSALVTATL